MTDRRKPRDFWLRYDKFNHFLTCHKYEKFRKNMGDYTVHVREVISPDPRDETLKNCYREIWNIRSLCGHPEAAEGFRRIIQKCTEVLEKIKELGVLDET